MAGAGRYSLDAAGPVAAEHLLEMADCFEFSGRGNDRNAVERHVRPARFFGTGIFTVLSLIEKPTWALMRDRGALSVTDENALMVHAILERVIHVLPPTMITTMTIVSVLIAVQLFRSGFATTPVVVAAVFYVQLIAVVIPVSRRSAASAACRPMARSGRSSTAWAPSPGSTTTAW